MIYHDLPWFTMIYNDLQWFTMIYLLIWWWCSSSQTLGLMSFPHNSELWGSENQGFRPVFSWGIPPKKVSILYKMVSWMCLGLDLGIPLSIFWYIFFWVSILEVSAIFTWQSAVRDVSRRLAAHLEQRGSNMDSAASVKCAFSVAFSC